MRPTPSFIPVHTQSVVIANDTTAALGWQLDGTAAICFEEGEHLGVHFVIPGVDDAARSVLADMVEDNGLYVLDPAGAHWAIVEDHPDANVLDRFYTYDEATTDLAEGGYLPGSKVQYVFDAVTYATSKGAR